MSTQTSVLLLCAWGVEVAWGVAWEWHRGMALGVWRVAWGVAWKVASGGAWGQGWSF